MVRLTDHPDMTIAVHRGRKITTQQGDGWMINESFCAMESRVRLERFPLQAGLELGTAGSRPALNLPGPLSTGDVKYRPDIVSL